MGLFTHTEAAIRAGETALRIIGAGFYRLGGFCYIFRRIGGTWERNSLLTDFPLPVCSSHHPDCVFTQQAFRSRWRLECVLGYGSDYRGHFPCHLPQGNHRPVTAARKVMNTVLTPLSRVNSCFSKMNSYCIMETATNDRRQSYGNQKNHQEFSLIEYCLKSQRSWQIITFRFCSIYLQYGLSSGQKENYEKAIQALEAAGYKMTE